MVSKPLLTGIKDITNSLSYKLTFYRLNSIDILLYDFNRKKRQLSIIIVYVKIFFLIFVVAINNKPKLNAKKSTK